MFFNKAVKNINRVREVINILLKYGFEDMIAGTTLRKLIPARNQAQWTRYDKPVLAYSRWERIRMAMEELGPTFIKLAQFLSNRPDLLPEGLIVEFEKLQSDAPAIDSEVVQAIIEKETGKKMEDLFDFFDKKALGSASIGQVHRATLKNGEEVVVKVQRPGAKNKMNTDLSLLRDLVKLTDNYFRNAGILNPQDIVDAFEQAIQQELDYTIEARNMEQFRKVYAQNINFYTPKPYKEFSTDKVLLIEYIHGCKITDIPQLEVWGLNPQKMAEKGMNIYLSQIFEQGFFHADPHPGNILVRPNGTIVLIDFGMVGKLLKHQKYAFAGFLVGLANQNAKAMAVNLRRLAVENEINNMQEFEDDLNGLIEHFFVFDLEEAGIADFTAHLQQIIYKYRLQIPGSIFLILRAMALLEGIGKVLHPKFQTLDFIRPYGVKLIAEQFSFKNQRNELTYTFSQLVSLFYIFPIEFKFILNQLRNGEFNLNLAIRGYEQLLKKIDSATNRLVLAFLISALLIASSISLHIPQNTAVYRTPSISILGFTLAGILSIWLFAYSFLGGNGKEKKR